MQQIQKVFGFGYCIVFLQKVRLCVWSVSIVHRVKQIISSRMITYLSLHTIHSSYHNAQHSTVGDGRQNVVWYKLKMHRDYGGRERTFRKLTTTTCPTVLWINSISYRHSAIMYGALECLAESSLFPWAPMKIFLLSI